MFVLAGLLYLVYAMQFVFLMRLSVGRKRLSYTQTSSLRSYTEGG